MKKLITIMAIILNAAISNAQAVSNTQQNTYDFLEIFDYSAEKYEAYKSAVSTTITVIETKNKIEFRGAINNVNFKIKNSQATDSTLSYSCVDLKNNRDCDITFGHSVTTYNVTIKYPTELIQYRLKRAK